MTQEQWLEMGYALSRVEYAKSLGFNSYPWQTEYLTSSSKRRMLCVARQGGKSYSTSLIPTHTAKYIPKSLSIVTAATERQAGMDMKKILEFISKDPRYPKMTRNSDDLIHLSNGSEIVVVPATEKSARGDTRPRVVIMDEAAYVGDRIMRTGIRPMLNNNPKCELLIVSTPNGREGFFWRAFNSERWERYLVISPYDVDDVAWKLQTAEPEEDFQAKWATRGIKAWYSPEHMNHADQADALLDLGPTDYRQEMRGEFVEREGAVFEYDDIESMFQPEVEKIKFQQIGKSSEKALVVARD